MIYNIQVWHDVVDRDRKNIGIVEKSLQQLFENMRRISKETTCLNNGKWTLVSYEADVKRNLIKQTDAILDSIFDENNKDPYIFGLRVNLKDPKNRAMGKIMISRECKKNQFAWVKNVYFELY